MTNWISKDRNTPYAFGSLLRNVRFGGISRYKSPVIDKEITLPSLEGYLYVTSLSPVSSYGPAGGPFSVEFSVYVLTNTGGAAIDWSASSDVAWIDLDVASGHLEPGQSVNVTATLDANALAVNPYPYTGAVTFANDTSSSGGGSAAWSLSVTGDLAMTLDARTRAGTATLIGFSEYASPSTPPKKYRTQTLSGFWRSCNWTSPVSGTCSGGQQNDKDMEVYSGAYTYNQYTGAQTNNQLARYGRFIQSGGDNSPCDNNITLTSSSTPSANFSPSYLPAGHFSLVTTPTDKTWTYDGVCFQPVGTYGRQMHGTASSTLSDEDTEADALARMNASAVWGPWGAVASKGDAASEYEERTSGFSFAVTEAQWRASLSGLVPSQSYACAVDLYKRAYGTSDPWVLDSAITFTGVADGFGVVTHSDDTPQSPGYEYCVFNATLTIA